MWRTFLSFSLVYVSVHPERHLNWYNCQDVVVRKHLTKISFHKIRMVEHLVKQRKYEQNKAWLYQSINKISSQVLTLLLFFPLPNACLCTEHISTFENMHIYFKFNIWTFKPWKLFLATKDTTNIKCNRKLELKAFQFTENNWNIKHIETFNW